MRHAPLLAILTAVLVGCGDPGPPDKNPAPKAQATTSGGRIYNAQKPAYTEREIVQALDLKDGTDLGNEECVASVILATPSEISVYASAGDTVATNDAGTVGVKVGTYQGGPSTAECARRFAKLLSERLP